MLQGLAKFPGSLSKYKFALLYSSFPYSPLHGLKSQRFLFGILCHVHQMRGITFSSVSPHIHLRTLLCARSALLADESWAKEITDVHAAESPARATACIMLSWPIWKTGSDSTSRACPMFDSLPNHIPTPLSFQAEALASASTERTKTKEKLNNKRRGHAHRHSDTCTC
jgi:hypothetical protein